MGIKMEISSEEIKDVVFKPCPFCGGTNLLVTEKKNFDELCEEHGHSMLNLRCRVCDTEMHEYSIPNNNYWMGVGMLIARWNTRNGGNEHGNQKD